MFFFFFQAEDGIRDGTVTGVQTCALPIFEQALANVTNMGLYRVERDTRRELRADPEIAFVELGQEFLAESREEEQREHDTGGGREHRGHRPAQTPPEGG